MMKNPCKAWCVELWATENTFDINLTYTQSQGHTPNPNGQALGPDRFRVKGLFKF